MVVDFSHSFIFGNLEKLKDLKESVVKLSKENDEMESLQARTERERESLQMTINELEEALQDAEVRPISIVCEMNNF